MNLVGQHFGEWEVLEYSGHSRWKCKCSCGKIKDVRQDSLIRQESLSCGHHRNQDRIIDLKGKTFGEWAVLEYVSKGFWKCQCSCGKIKNVYSRALRIGDSTSCGHLSAEKQKNTMLSRYGDIAPNRIGNPRKKELIHILNNKVELTKFIGSYGYKPTIDELCRDLDVTKSFFRNKIHIEGLDDSIEFLQAVSDAEISLRRYVQSIYDKDIIKNSREIISPYELDIYIPEKKLAIEFNGNYWHSTKFKDKQYHQDKTIACAKNGVRLIHVYEYEWNNDRTRKIIEEIIKKALQCEQDSTETVDVSDITIDNATKDDIDIINTIVINKVNSNNKIICAKYENRIVGIIEIDSCYICNIFAINEAILIKLLEYINKNSSITELFIDIDIGKFYGNTLYNIGFKILDNDITEPRLVYKDSDNEVYNSGFLKMSYKFK